MHFVASELHEVEANLVNVLAAMKSQLSCQNPNHPHDCRGGEACEFVGIGSVIDSTGEMSDCFETISHLKSAKSVICT